MSWLQRYRIRHYFANSIWLMPVMSIVLALAVGPLLRRLRLVLELGVRHRWERPSSVNG